MAKIQDQGFLIHRRPYRETSLLVDIFTRQHGRIQAVVKGAQSGKSPKSRALQPFALLNLQWSGKHELVSLYGVEQAAMVQLSGQMSLCGMYLNELLWHLLENYHLEPQIFTVYTESLDELSNANADPEPILRHFELTLLSAMGVAFLFDWDAVSESPIAPHQSYSLDLQQGFYQQQQGAFLGERLLKIQQRDFSDALVRRDAKRICRFAMDSLLKGKQLKSREWIKASLKTMN